MGASPVGASPVGASPVGASPVGASPVGASPVGASPGAGSSPPLGAPDVGPIVAPGPVDVGGSSAAGGSPDDPIPAIGPDVLPSCSWAGPSSPPQPLIRASDATTVTTQTNRLSRPPSMFHSIALTHVPVGMTLTATARTPLARMATPQDGGEPRAHPRPAPGVVRPVLGSPLHLLC